MHLESIKIDNFRGIAQPSEVKGFNKLTVVVGPNNSGKSTLLESIYLLKFPLEKEDKNLYYIFFRRGDFGKSTIRETFNVNRGCYLVGNFSEKEKIRHNKSLRRYFSFEKNSLIIGNYCYSILPSFDQEKTFLKYTGKKNNEEGAEQLITEADEWDDTSLSLRFEYPIEFIDTKEVNQNQQLEKLYSSRLERLNQTQEFVKMLSGNSQALKDLIDLRLSVEEDNSTVLYASFSKESKKKRHPAYFLGDGAKKLMQIFGTISKCKDGICLLEEPEAFQHPKYSRLMIKIFEDAIYKNNTQVILCTHSLEFLDDILENFKELGENKIDDVSILKTKLEDGKMSAYEYKGNEAVEAREEIGIDLRG